MGTSRLDAFAAVLINERGNGKGKREGEGCGDKEIAYLKRAKESEANVITNLKQNSTIGPSIF